jgi:hypothetical protein
MMKQGKEYIRLPGKGRVKAGFVALARTKASLYAGPDHLLSVYNSFFTEDYRRFYFRDIQAIVVSGTPARTRWSALSGSIALLLLLLAYLAGEYWGVFFISLAILFLIIFAVNFLKGPTCCCRLYTAASQTELPSLGRLGYAMKTLDIIRPLIEQSQGTISTEEIKARMNSTRTGPEGPGA